MPTTTDTPEVTPSAFADLADTCDETDRLTYELKDTAEDLAAALDDGRQDEAEKRVSDVMALAYELTHQSVRLDAITGRIQRGEQ
jgi:hypothetical protein